MQPKKLFLQKSCQIKYIFIFFLFYYLLLYILGINFFSRLVPLLSVGAATLQTRTTLWYSLCFQENIGMGSPCPLEPAPSLILLRNVKSKFLPIPFVSGVSEETRDRRPSQRLDHLQWQEQGALWLALTDGEESGAQLGAEHRGDGGKAEEGEKLRMRTRHRRWTDVWDTCRMMRRLTAPLNSSTSPSAAHLTVTG